MLSEVTRMQTWIKKMQGYKKIFYDNIKNYEDIQKQYSYPFTGDAEAYSQRPYDYARSVSQMVENMRNEGMEIFPLHFKPTDTGYAEFVKIIAQLSHYSYFNGVIEVHPKTAYESATILLKRHQNHLRIDPFASEERRQQVTEFKLSIEYANDSLCSLLEKLFALFDELEKSAIARLEAELPLKDQIAKLKAENESLKNEVARFKEQNALLTPNSRTVPAIKPSQMVHTMIWHSGSMAVDDAPSALSVVPRPTQSEADDQQN